MITIYDYNDYLAFFRAYLQEQPKKGHGLLSQWAKKLKVSTTLISQILGGKKSLNLEMAIDLAKILDLRTKETDYFLLLVQWERAGHTELRKYFKKKIEEMQSASRLLKNKIEDVDELSSEIQAQYYSSWVYAGLRNLLACHPDMNAGKLAQELKVSRARTVEALEFLQLHNLIALKDGKWTIGSQHIYLASDSPLVNKHHQNWRIKSLQKMEERQEEDLFFTSPMSVSVNASKILRKDIINFVQDVRKKAGPSPSETVRCLNIDWFEP